MKTIILPGYSVSNKDWAEEMAKGLNAVGIETDVHYWRHWSENKSLSIKFEVDKILQEVGDQEINILAKSVGVMVALNLIPKISSQVIKVILCGIASVANKDRKDLLRALVAEVPVENILCIQNENDKYVKFSDAERFYHSAEPKLKIISKPRSDHDYPYPEEFQIFLRD